MARKARNTSVKKQGNLAYHLIQSFSPDDAVTPELAHKLGRKLAMEFTDGKFEFVVATHINKDSIHNHIIINAVSFYDYKKLRTVPYRTAQQIRSISDRLCMEAQLSVIKDPQQLGQLYPTYVQKKRTTSNRTEVRKKLNFCLERATNYAQFLQMAQELGISVCQRTDAPALVPFSYAGCVWVLAKPRRSDDVCLALLVLGVVTSFCDLLVTPVLTLGLPLVCWLLEPQQRLRAGTRQCGIVVGGSLTWGVGYLLCWASKWVLAGLVTGQNVIADALHQVGVRTAADSWHGMELTWRNILHFVYTTLAGKHLFWPLVLAVVLLLALFAASIRDRQQLARALPLGLCALMTPAWFIVLRTHSIQHGWFTWRALGLTVFAGLAFLYYCCDVRQIAKRLKRT